MLCALFIINAKVRKTFKRLSIFVILITKLIIFLFLLWRTPAELHSQILPFIWTERCSSLWNFMWPFVKFFSARFPGKKLTYAPLNKCPWVQPQMLINNRLKLWGWQYLAFKCNNTKDAFISNPTWICVTECYGVKNQVQRILTANVTR